MRTTHPCATPAILLGGHADGWISAGNSLEELTTTIGRIQSLRHEYGTDQRSFQIQAITREAYSADGIRRLESLGVTECIISFRDIYSGQQDPTLQQKLDTINWFTDEVIHKSRSA